MKNIFKTFVAVAIVVTALPVSAAAPFVGHPRTRAELNRCEIVESLYSHRVYMRPWANRIIARMAPKWANCVVGVRAQAPRMPQVETGGTRTPAQLQLDQEARNMMLYGDPRGRVELPVTVVQPAPVVVAPAPVVVVVPEPSVPVPVVTPPPAALPVPIVVAPEPSVPAPALPHFLGAPYFVDQFGRAMTTSPVYGVAIRFSQALTVPNNVPTGTPYQLFCTNVNSPNGINLPTFSLDDKSERISAVVDFLGDHGVIHHHVCRFRFTDPIVVESEAIEFDL